MAITRINQFEAKQGLEERLHEFLKSVISIIKNDSGCTSCQLFCSTDNPAHFAIIEEWDSIEAHQNAAKSISPDKMKEAMALFAQPPSGEYYKT